MRRRFLVVVAGVVVVAAACGSTAQVASPTTAEPGLDMSTAGSTSGAPVASPEASGQVATGTAARRGPATGGAGTAAAQALAPAADAGGLPGVTNTAITIGVLAADPGTNETMENAGLGAASIGNEPANWQAVADEVNARGGIAGRRVALIFHLVNLTEPPQQQGQAACAKFTQDNAVAAVVSGYYYASAHLCLSKAGVPALLGTNYGVDAALAQQSRTVVAWATPLLDRIAAVVSDGFRAMGKLKPGTTAGIFVTDAPAYRRSAARLSADLTQRGLTVVTQTVHDSDTGDYAAAANDASAAVLRFNTAGVTEVMFLTHNAFEPTVLMQAANAQRYEPTYLLSTQQYPAALVGLVPPDQLAGALAIGWAPAIDLVTGYDASPEAQRCMSMLKARGRSFSNATQALAGLLACDAVDLLERAAGRPGALASRDALLRSSLADTGFVSAVTFQTSFPGGRRDGVAAYRPMAYVEGCNCFAYNGPITPM